MINFQYTIIKLRAFNADRSNVMNYPVKIKYYDTTDQSWHDLYDTMISKGGLYIEGDMGNPTDEEVAFFDLLHAGYLPPVIVVPATPPATGELQKVVAGGSYFQMLDDEFYELDLGTYHMAPEDAITSITGLFKYFQPVASMFPFSLPEPEPENGPVPIQDLYTNLVSEIAAASETSRDSAFKLSNISLKLKAVVHGDGESLSASLLDLENSENINGNAISELVFDITPVDNRETTEATMPDVTGLTETAVRRILKSLGLKLNPVYQNKQSVTDGDSFKQSPAEGDSIQPNQLITVIFSKHE